MTHQKYITFEREDGRPELYPFSEARCHADVAVEDGRKVLSAGFFDQLSLRCYGESISLGKQADVLRDTALLRARFNACGEWLDNLPPMLRMQAC